MIPARDGRVGDVVRLDRSFNGRVTLHRIVERIEGPGSQTGVRFVVTPPVPKGSGGPLDSAWFTIDSRVLAQEQELLK